MNIKKIMIFILFYIFSIVLMFILEDMEVDIFKTSVYQNLMLSFFCFVLIYQLLNKKIEKLVLLFYVLSSIIFLQSGYETYHNQYIIFTLICTFILIMFCDFKKGYFRIFFIPICFFLFQTIYSLTYSSIYYFFEIFVR